SASRLASSFCGTSCFLVVIVFADKQALACGGLSVYTKFCTPSLEQLSADQAKSNDENGRVQRNPDRPQKGPPILLGDIVPAHKTPKAPRHHGAPDVKPQQLNLPLAHGYGGIGG
ncbi:hypothetical protein, partial [Acidovorax sp. SD340]|uniref:hypothetical protein n=1 Tax=Acidovorax sp. SD340 TaxID=1690268 RepID=UPI001EE49EDB